MNSTLLSAQEPCSGSVLTFSHLFILAVYKRLLDLSLAIEKDMETAKEWGGEGERVALVHIHHQCKQITSRKLPYSAGSLASVCEDLEG